MDIRPLVHVLEDDEEDQKPVIPPSFFSSGEHVIVSSTTSTSLTAAISHNSLPISDPCQVLGLAKKESSEYSLSSSLQQSTSQRQQLTPHQQPQQQQPQQQQQPPPSQQSQPQSAPQQQQVNADNGSSKKSGGTSQAISFGTLMPMLLPTLQPDQSQKLLALYQKLKRTEISKEDFLRTTRALVGDQLLVQTVKQMQIKQQMQGQVRQQVQVTPDQPQQISFSPNVQQQQLKTSIEQSQHRQLPQVPEMGQSRPQQTAVQQLQSSIESRVSSHQILTSDSQQDQWHGHQSQSTSSPLTVQQIKPEGDKSQDGDISTVNISGVPSSSSSYILSPLAMPQVSLTIPEGVVNYPSSNQVRTPPKKIIIDQKRPADISPVMQGKSKKQKVAGDVLEQSIDQLNDVTAVSGVNLREEEEQLLAGPKEESRSTQAMRRFAQEEEGRLFLEKGPLHSKVTAIAAKLGVSLVSEEAELCLSMCAEERLRTMIYKLSKIASRRVDREKAVHKIVITTNFQKQIMAMQKKAKEEYERKQALESERLRKITEEKERASNEPSTKEDGPSRPKEKKTKGEDGKQKGGSGGSRAASGVNDMLLKWQMMAEQGRQKREGESGASTASDTGRATINQDVEKKQSGTEIKATAPGRTTLQGGATAGPASALKKVQGIKGDAAGSRRHLYQANVPSPPIKPPQKIGTKDVIACLETEPQMAKSPLLYRLYDKNISSSQTV